MDEGDVEVGPKLLDEEVEGVLVLGEDEELLARVVAQPFLGHHLEQFVQLALGAGSLGLLRLDQEGPQRLEFGLQLDDGGRQPLLECLLLQLPQLGLVKVADILGVLREDARLEVLAVAQVGLRIGQCPFEPVNPSLEGALDRPHRRGEAALHRCQGKAGGAASRLPPDLSELLADEVRDRVVKVKLLALKLVAQRVRIARTEQLVARHVDHLLLGDLAVLRRVQLELLRTAVAVGVGIKQP